MAGNGGSGSYLTPEAQARIEIDRQLEAAGWVVQDHRAINLAATAPGGKVAGVAVREFPLAAGHGVADYLLFVDRQAVGVLEAKKGRDVADRGRDPVRQVRHRPAGRSVHPGPAASVRLRVHRRRDPFH